MRRVGSHGTRREARNRGMRRRRRTLVAVEGFAAVLLIWLAATLVVPARLLPGPLPTISRAIALLGAGELARHLGASILRIAAAMGAAIAIGVPLGIAIARRAWARRIAEPVAYVLYPVPKIALLPMLILLLGIGNVAKVTLIVLIIVFQLLFAARDGVRSIPDSYLLSAQSLRLRGWALQRHLVIPAILPRLFTALRLSLGISFSVVFFAESFATRYGIGSFIVNAWAQVSYLDMYAGIIALSVAGFLLFRAVDLLERLSCPWLSGNQN